MRKITLLIAFFFFQIVCAQTPDWEWVRNMNLHFNTTRQLSSVDSNGDIIVITDFITPTVTFGGITVNNYSPSYYYADLAIVKYDNQGNVIWAKSYGGPRVDNATAIITDTAGNFYIAGGFMDSITFDSVTLTSNNSTGNFVVKFDTDGNVIFAKKVTEDSAAATISAIKLDSNANIYLTGFFNTPTVTFGNITLNYEDYTTTGSSNRAYVAKMDNQGNYLWAKTAQSNDNHHTGIVPYGMDVDTNGNVYVGGFFGCNTVRFGTVTITKTITSIYNMNMYLVKYDADGNEMWARNTGSNYENETATRTVKTDLQNNVYAAGYFTNAVTFGNTTLMSSGGSQQFIVKYDPSGTVLWAKSANADYGFNMVQSIDIDENNNFYTAGTYANSQVNFGNGVILNNPLPVAGALFIVKYTPAGEAVWGRKANPFYANNLVSIDCKSRNEIYVTGVLSDSAVNFGNQVVTKSENTFDLFLARLYYEPLSTADWDRTKVNVYPNPVKDLLSISNPDAYTTYVLYNVLGSKVTEGFIRPEKATIDLSLLSKGVYMLQLKNQETKSETVKIIKE